MFFRFSAVFPFSIVRRFCSRAHLHPLTKKIKTNTKKIQKIPNFVCVVHKFMRHVRSKFQLIWTSEKLSAKKKIQGLQKSLLFTQCSDPICFFAESCSDVQISWNLERTSLIWIFLIFFSICFIFFLAGCRWAWHRVGFLGDIDEEATAMACWNKNFSVSPYLNHVWSDASKGQVRVCVTGSVGSLQILAVGVWFLYKMINALLSF